VEPGRGSEEMISMEMWTTIRYLRAQGWGIRAIARELGVSRNTVRKALVADSPPRYERPARPNPQLEPFAEEIRRMFFEQHFIGTRILRELRQRGYQGSQAALYRHLARLKKHLPSDKVSLRYETPPGQQAQFDWSPYTVELGGALTRVVVFCLILGYSRRKHYWPSLNERQASIFEALEEGFWHFGGVPKEVLVDNARAMVVNANPRHFQWNPRFLELCGHYRVKPVPCPVGRPRTKGKVEKPFFYLEEHFIKGNSFPSFSRFCQELARFQAQELDVMVHHTTRERPIDRFQRERAHLTPLPPGRFVSTREEVRKVSWDCLISFAGSRYSVPYQYAGKQVWVRASQGATLQVYSQRGQLIASHPLSRKRGATLLQEEHYAGLRKTTPRTRVLLERAFLELFPDQGAVLDKLYAQQKLNPVAHLKPILELAGLYPRQALLKAFGLAHEYNTFSHHFIRGLLERELPTTFPPERGPAPLAGLPSVSVSRDLRVYQQLLLGEKGGDGR
jgi:transposase